MFDKNLLRFFLISTLFISCSKDDNPVSEEGTTPVDITLNKSLVQKGPFVQGSTISLQELNNDLTLSGNVYNTETIDDFGSFDVNAVLQNNKVDISATGFYFNEVSGKLSDAPLTLRTFVEFNNDDKVNLNILTTIARQRIKYLMTSQEMSFIEAKNQAEKETLDAFYIPESLQTSTLSFEEMDISQNGESNGILLAISSILQGNNSVAELGEFVAKLAEDLKEDGIINNSLLRSEIIENSIGLNFEEIKQNLEKRFTEIGIEFSIPEFKNYVDSDGDGTINLLDIMLISPIGEINNSKPEFSWQGSGIADTKYHFQLSDNENFENLLIDESNLQDTAITSTILLENNTSYYWRVNYLQEDGTESDWNSSTFNLYISGVNLVFPNNTIVSSSPNFEWEESIATDVTYQIQVATDSSFSNLIFEQSNISETSIQPPSILQQINQEYYWRVRILDQNEVNGEWATTSFLFEIQSVNLVFPNNTVVLSSPNFEWSENTMANATYQIQVATDSSFSSIIFEQSNISETSIQTSSILQISGQDYHWRVRVLNQNGISGEWTTTSFTLEIEEPIIQGQVSPNDLYAYEITYDGQNNPDYIGYDLEVQIASDYEFNTVVKTITSIKAELNRKYPIWDATVDGFGNYFYRVRYINPEGIGGFWSRGSFDINEAQVFLTDVDLTSLNPKIIWSHGGGTDGIIPNTYNYKVIIANDVNFTNVIEESIQPVVEDTATQFPSYTINMTLNQNVTYYYKISIIDPTGLEIASETSSFNIQL